MSRLGRAWRRLWSRGGGDPEAAQGDADTHGSSAQGGGASDPVTDSDAPTAPSSPAPKAPDSPGERLAAVFDLEDEAQEAMACEAFDQLVRSGHAARAIALGRRALERSAGGRALRVRVAEAQVVRADDAGALDTLESLLDRADIAIPVLAMAARTLDRLGQETRASGVWHRVLARDVDYPGARQRVGRVASAPASAGATLAAGGELSGGRYLVRRELGRGGAGAVFEALDRQLGRPVALKVYHDRGAAARARLRLEARVPAGVEHPGVIRIFDLDLQLGAIVMEWVRGPSLASALKQPNLDPGDARRWLVSLVDALGFVHGSGLVHRDLKPSNVLLRRDQSAVLTDFGLALPVGESPSRAGEGTQGFAAPEQLRAAAADCAADVHALGVLLDRASPAFPAELGTKMRALGRECAATSPASRPSLSEVAERLEGILHGA